MVTRVQVIRKVLRGISVLHSRENDDMGLANRDDSKFDPATRVRIVQRSQFKYCCFVLR